MPDERQQEQAAEAGASSSQVHCPNCGGDFEDVEPRCPYCGALNPKGAERAYMQRLDEIEEDTGELAQDAERGFKASVGGNVKLVATVVGIVVLIVAALFAIVHFSDQADERRALEEYNARETFREQYFGELERLYDEGDSMALADYALSLLDEPGYDAIYSWEHYDYLDICIDHSMLSLLADDIGAGSAKFDDHSFATSLAARVAGFDEGYSHKLSRADEAKVAGYRSEALSFLERELQMDEQQVGAFLDESRDADGHIDSKKLEASLKSRLRELGTIN